MNLTVWKRPGVAAALACAMGAHAASAEVLVNGRRAVQLETPVATVAIDLGGGSIVDFHLAGGGLNPLRWLGPGDENAALRPMAHFLCLDRWGAPSAAEQKSGMPFHGEASRVEWKQLRAPATHEGWVNAAMSAMLPLAGLEVERTVSLSQSAAIFKVSETVVNRNKLGRIYNQVQHPTIGPPFLDETTVVDANGGKGFMQSSPLPNPETPEVAWPNAILRGQPVDLRRLTTNPDPNVVSFVIDEEYGWVTATNAAKGLLYGYIWKKADYPWLNIWRHVVQGKPMARGLEFGTTGLHQPFPVLVAKQAILGRPLYVYLDAGQSATREYAAFLVRTPPDFQGAARVAYADGRISIAERGGSGRVLTVQAGRLF